MRILIVSAHDNRGGAAKSAYRFSKEFIKQGHKVCLYVRDKKEKEDFIVESRTPKLIAKFFHFLDFLPGYLLSGFNRDVPFTLGLYGESLNKIIKEFKPDIINIHWTWKGFVSFPEICRLSKQIPVVWTAHDTSLFNDGYFYPAVGKLPLIGLLRWGNKIIREILSKGANLTVVSPSQFLLSEYKKSWMSKYFHGLVINNGMDISAYHNLKRKKSDIKKSLGLDLDKKYILFGALNLVGNEVKGGNILKESLEKAEEFLLKENIGLIAFGVQNPFEDILLDDRINQRFEGYLSTEQVLALMKASDLVLVPSRYENYPFVVMEALISGTPVVAFKTGGIPELVDREEKGILVKLSKPEEFSVAIINVLSRKQFSWDTSSYDIVRKAQEYLKLFDHYVKTGRS